jgi:ATP-binding cassette subfamily A (ABC1) protein 3
MAVLGEPPIVFLDEPSSGIDPQNRRFMWDIIEDLKAEDRAVILTTHHLQEAEVLSEDVIVMSRGKILVQGTPEYIKANFGIGYELFFRNISLSAKESLIEQIKTTFGDTKTVDFNQNDFESQKLICLTIPLSQVEKTSEFLQGLEKRKINFGLRANTLEEAFVKMGEKEFKTGTD